MAARIVGTGAALPARSVSTAELVARCLPAKDPAAVEARIGIRARRWLGPGESAAGLATEAARRALAMAGLPPSSVRRLILVTSTGGDQLIPATANGVLAGLGLDDSCDAFDVQNSCAGFLTGLDLAARCVDTGLDPVAVVAVETFSRDLSPEEPRSYLVLGDAAAAAIVSASPTGEGPDLRIGGRVLANTARLRGQMRQPHLHRSDARRGIAFDTEADLIGESARFHILRGTERVLAASGLGWADVRWFLPHQPNGALLAELMAAAGVEAHRTVPVVAEVGSIASAAVPFSLDRLVRSGQIRAGDLLLLASVGSGSAYGAALLEAAG